MFCLVLFSFPLESFNNQVLSLALYISAASVGQKEQMFVLCLIVAFEFRFYRPRLSDTVWVKYDNTEHV